MPIKNMTDDEKKEREKLIEYLETHCIDSYGELQPCQVADFIINDRKRISLTTLSVEFHKNEVDRIVEILNKLVNKLELIHEDSNYKTVWSMYYIHGGRYNGPNYMEELRDAKQVLNNFINERKPHASIFK